MNNTAKYLPNLVERESVARFHDSIKEIESYIRRMYSDGVGWYFIQHLLYESLGIEIDNVAGLRKLKNELGVNLLIGKTFEVKKAMKDVEGWLELVDKVNGLYWSDIASYVNCCLENADDEFNKDIK